MSLSSTGLLHATDALFYVLMKVMEVFSLSPWEGCCLPDPQAQANPPNRALCSSPFSFLWT
jgi:hypothetical protein